MTRKRREPILPGQIWRMKPQHGDETTTIRVVDRDVYLVVATRLTGVGPKSRRILPQTLRDHYTLEATP